MRKDNYSNHSNFNEYSLSEEKLLAKESESFLVCVKTHNS